MQILPATHSRMYKVDKSDFGIIEGLVTSFCQASKLHLLVKCLIEQLLFNIIFKNETLGMFFFRCRTMGVGPKCPFSPA